MIGIYCRISRLKEDSADRSINDQRELGIELANKLGIPYSVYIDEGISGTLPIDERPEFSRLIEDIYSGLIKAVYVFDQSRLERSPEVRFSLLRIFEENNIDLYTASGKVTNDEETEFVGNVMSLANNFYVKMTKKKIKSVLRRNAKEGRAFSVNPYGYTKNEQGELIIDNQENEVVKDIFNMSLQGIGTDTIALKLREMGVPTRRGGTWSGKQVQDIIKNPIHKGYRRWGTKSGHEEEFHVQELASMSVEYWDKVNANLHNNRNSGEQQMKFNYLLKGLCTCAVCGRNYYGRTRKAIEGKKPNDHYYMCSSKRKGQVSCGNRSIGIDKLESLVWDVVKSGVLKSELLNYFESANKSDVREGVKKDIDTIHNRLSKVELKIKRLLELYLDNELERTEFLDKKTELNSEKDLMLSQLSRFEEQLSKTDLRLAEVTEDLDELRLMEMLSFNEKRQLLFKYIDRVKILSIEGNAHYVGVNIIHGAIPLVYWVGVKGDVKPLKVGFILENKHILKELGNNKEFKPTLSIIGESNG